MDDIFTRPRAVYNRDANQLGNGIPTRYVPKGPGDPPKEFSAKLLDIVSSADPASYAVVKGIAEGTLPKEVVASFIRDLSICVHRLGAIDGLVAWKAEWYGFDNVLRISQATAQNWGYWTRELPLAEQLIPLVEKLGGDITDLPITDCSINMHVYLRVRESLSQGGAGLEVGLASTFPEAQWSVMGPIIAKGLVQHYGLDESEVKAIKAIAAVDTERGKDRIAILEDIALSRRQQDMTLRAAKEILSVFAWSMNHLSEQSLISRTA